jgi:hypothetical protein
MTKAAGSLNFLSTDIATDDDFGLWTKLRLRMARSRARGAARGFFAYCTRDACISGLKRFPPGPAVRMLASDLENTREERPYRESIPGFLMSFWCKEAEDACYRVLANSACSARLVKASLLAIAKMHAAGHEDRLLAFLQTPGMDDSMRVEAVSILADAGVAARSPYFEVILAGFTAIPAKLKTKYATLLCRTKRTEVIVPVVTYAVEAPAEGCPFLDVKNALEKMAPNWTATPEALQLAPLMLRSFQDAASARDRSNALFYMGVLGAVDFVPTLRAATKDQSPYVVHSACDALKEVAKRHNLPEELAYAEDVLKEQEAATEQEEEEQAARRRTAAVVLPAPTGGILPGQCFEARGSMTLLIYGECLESTAPGIIYARCYSNLCPSGENGPFHIERIIRLIDRTEFESIVRMLRG